MGEGTPRCEETPSLCRGSAQRPLNIKREKKVAHYRVTNATLFFNRFFQKKYLNISTFLYIYIFSALILNYKKISTFASLFNASWIYNRYDGV